MYQILIYFLDDFTNPIDCVTLSPPETGGVIVVRKSSRPIIALTAFILAPLVSRKITLIKRINASILNEFLILLLRDELISKD